MNESENKKVISLKLKTIYGKFYLIASIVMIILAIVLAIVARVTMNFAFVWILVVLGVAYCIVILLGEIMRYGIFKKDENEE